ncbi:MAG: tail fiber domain-containing protein [Bacteroidia bacterium]|nr:tail fiber domain-containing protein [Bacteroidia bacterium]
MPDPSVSTRFNTVSVGANTIATANNQVRLGDASIASFYCMGAYAATTANPANMYVETTGQIMRSTSSKRYKKDIEDLEINTSLIYYLHPVSFTGISDNERHFGLIAEEVAEVIPELADYAEEKDVIPGSNSDKLIPDAVHYPLLSVLLLKEVQKHEEIIQEQQQSIEKQQKTINEFRYKNQALEAQVSVLKENITTIQSMQKRIEELERLVKATAGK